MEDLQKCQHMKVHMDRVFNKIEEECWTCTERKDDKLWECLECGFVGCGGKTENKHSFEHYSQTGHPLVYNPAQKTLWCYECSCRAIRGEELEEFPESSDGESKQIAEIERNYSGLRNLGNTCYMNSSIQALFHCSGLTQCLQYIQPHEKMWHQATFAFCKLLRVLWKAAEPVAVPKEFQRGMARLSPIFGDGTQQDSLELIRILFEQLHKDFRGDKKGLFEGTSIVSELFGGSIKSTVICLKCKNKIKKIEPIYDIPIEMFRENRKPLLERATQLVLGEERQRLEACLESFFSVEILEDENRYFCEKCKKREKAEKQLRWLSPTPNILILQLKRFHSGGLSLSKIKTGILFPEELDMKPYTDSQETDLYELNAVITHLGGFFGGHYVAFCKGTDNLWREFNDATVTKISQRKVLQSQAYVLFYQKKKPLSHVKKLERMFQELATQKRDCPIPRWLLLKTLATGRIEKYDIQPLICEHDDYKGISKEELIYVTVSFYNLVIQQNVGFIPSGCCSLCSEETEKEE